MTAPAFVSRSAKPSNWFSRRHQTNAAHVEAGRRWHERQVDKLARATIQNEETAERKVHDDIAAIRLEQGKTAKSKKNKAA